MKEDTWRLVQAVCLVIITLSVVYLAYNSAQIVDKLQSISILLIDAK